MEHKIKSFSKINVHLNVIKKLKSNFHRIETLVMFSDLYDLLYVKKINAKKHKITFYGKFSKNISSTNTISKLLNLLDKKNLGKLSIVGNNIYINTKGGQINCIIVQIENKKEMSAKDLLNGYQIHENSYVY